MELDYKHVSFDTYCQTCVHKDDDECSEPCNECLMIPARENSKKPEYYKRKEE